MERQKSYTTPKKKKTKERSLNKCIKKATFKNIDKPIKFTHEEIFDTPKKKDAKKK